MFKIQSKVVFDHIPQITIQMRTRIVSVVQKTLFEIERSSKESMQGPKSGRLYERAGGRMHQASAPGEAPAIDLGLLANSIQTKLESDLSGIVYTNTAYAEPLEFGSIKMAARPFMTPAAVKSWDGFIDGIKGALGEMQNG